jgi:hypothetical protein
LCREVLAGVYSRLALEVFPNIAPVWNKPPERTVGVALEKENRRKFMKSLLAAAAAVALLASAPAIAADNAMPNHDAPGKSTNSDGTVGKGADGASTGNAGSEAPGKSTNSDGSAGSAANAPGTSINDGAGSTEDQQPASGTAK